MLIIMSDIASLQELPKLLQDLATTDADLPWNKSKNRFPNIKPCEWMRRKLAHNYDTCSVPMISVHLLHNVTFTWI